MSEDKLLEKIRPYQERISQLTRSNYEKEVEIVILRHALDNLKNIMKDLQFQQSIITNHLYSTESNREADTQMERGKIYDER